MTTGSLDPLRKQLQTALVLEHRTIPPYLCALYTITPEENLAAFDIIHSVVMEEMLHMALVANVLNAVGGRPDFRDPRLMRPYPMMLLPRCGIRVGLLPFGEEALRSFLKIETPYGNRRRFTIGKFYHEIETSIRQLPETAFDPSGSRQVDPEFFYGPSKLIKVLNRDEALRAIQVIRDQGEGLKKSQWTNSVACHQFEQNTEPAHYYRFKQLLKGQFYKGEDTRSQPRGKSCTVNWESVIPMYANPKLSDYRPGTELRRRAEEFNRKYRRFLNLMHQGFNGEPKSLEQAVREMFSLKHLILDLLRQAHPKDPSRFAGPTFELPRTTAQTKSAPRVSSATRKTARKTARKTTR